MAKKTARDIPVQGKRVLLRVDFNVPQDPRTGAISDDTRIRASLPTINYLLGQKARLILCSHWGRPDGKVVEGLKLAPVAARLSQFLRRPVNMAPDCVGPAVEALAKGLGEGEVLMLENLRFHKEEEKNDPAFAQALARLAEVFVNDAFGTMHRAHASTVGVANYLPAVAGFLAEKELEVLGRALASPARPFSAIIGGAKVKDKMAMLENILGKVDALLIGGGMANTFLAAQGHPVGASAIEADRLDFARQLIEKAKGRGVRLLLPSDVVVAEKLDSSAPSQIVPADQVPEKAKIGDVGPQTVAQFGAELGKSRTVVWNGPLGVFEVSQFAAGTRAVAHILAELQAVTVIGGGSTAEAVEELGLASKMTHVSTGGGASLEFLEGKTLPGVAALQDR